MKNMEYRLLFWLMLAVATALSSEAGAQERTYDGFSGGDSTYLEDLERVFARNDDAQALDQFIDYWESGRFTSDQQQTIARLSRQFYQQRMRSTNGLDAFLNALVVWADSSGSSARFAGWTGVLKQMKTKRPHEINQFLEFSASFFRNGTFYESRTRAWRTSSAQWEMAYRNESVYIRFDKAQLEGVSRKDTLTIYDTRGTYNVDEQRWKGQGGKSNWSEYGIEPGKIYVKFDHYQIDTRASGFKADSATLYHHRVAPDGILGQYENRLQGNVDNYEQLSYPLFTSYRTNFQINDFGKGLEYRGGLGMQGIKILGNGSPGADARLTFKQNDRSALVARGQSFLMDSSKIIAPEVSISIPLGNEDSLFHPHRYMNYNKQKRKLRFSERDQLVSQAPFIDTYHQTEMDIGILEWSLDSSAMKFSTGMGDAVDAKFESTNYYSDAAYRSAEGVLGRNPLSRLAKFSEQYGRNNLPLELVASRFGSRDTKDILRTILDLHKRGFLIYNPEYKTLSLTPKLFRYVEAHYGKRDYDIIRYISNVDKGANATLHLDDQTLEIKGVPGMIISDSQDVFLQTADSTINLKKGHNFAFKGKLRAGRMLFKGDTFAFDYDAFKVELQNVDSANFFYPDQSDTLEGQEQQLQEVQTALQDLNGTLYIEDPQNKSSRKYKPEYPIIDISQSAFVYYDDSSIYNGVYRRDRFYFKPKPFKIDSADNFTQRGLSFEGTFRSAGIFPEIEETVELREDLSLGFVHKIPDSGYSVYQDKGRANGVIDISNKGLFASGSIEYQGATLRSQRFLMFPDSMRSQVESFSIPASMSNKYPTLEAENVRVFWRPYADSLEAYSGETVFPLYNQQVEVSGSVILTPDFLGGQGTLDYENATITSDSLVFEPSVVDVQSGELNLRMANGEALAYNNPVNDLRLDIDKREASGRSTSDTVVSSLPAFQYQTQIAQFDWDVNAQTLTLSKPDNQKVEDAYMLSTRESADSLQFNADIIDLDLKEQRLEADSVYFVVVADAKILPFQNEVTIRDDGSIEPLDSSKIVLNVDTSYHTVYNANVNIFSGKYFTASGYFDYVNDVGRTHTLYFNEISTQDDQTTKGLASVNPEDSFYIGAGFRFSGDVSMRSTTPDLNFDGVVLADHGNESLGTEGFSYNGEVDREDVSFQVKDATNAGREPLYSGIYFSKDFNEPYSILMGRKTNPKDKPMVAVSGVLSFDTEANEYVLEADSSLLEEDRKRKRKNRLGELQKRALLKSSFRYHPVDTEVTAYGVVSWPYEFEHVSMRPIGTLSFSAQDSLYRFRGMLTIDFPFGREAFGTLRDSVLAYSYYQPDLEAYENKNLLKSLSLVIEDTAQVRRGLTNIETTGQLVLDMDRDELPRIWLTSVNMFWDIDNESFRSEGKMGLLNLQDAPVSKEIKGRFEVKLGMEGGGAMTLYMIPYEGGYYFFKYDNGNMRVLSSDFEFIRQAGDPSGRVTRGGYDIQRAEPSEVSFFKGRFK